MVEQVVNQLVAMAIGLILGFFFERRASRETRDQNRKMRAELDALRSSVYTVGGSDKPIIPIEADVSVSPDKLAGEVIEFAKTIQDAAGCVRKSLLVEHFTSRGFFPDPVIQALDIAQQSGALSVDEMWVTIR